MKSLASPDQPAAQVVALAAQPLAAGQPTLTLDQARAFAQPLLAPQTLDSGENALAHAHGMAAILREMGGDEALQACPYLVYASEHLQRASETLARAFGEDHARLAQSVTQLNRLQRQARASANVNVNSTKAAAPTVSGSSIARLSCSPAASR